MALDTQDVGDAVDAGDVGDAVNAKACDTVSLQTEMLVSFFLVQRATCIL